MSANFTRCLAPSDDLDSPNQAYCCREHTELLVQEKDTLELWDDYGVIDNVKVCTMFISISSY